MPFLGAVASAWQSRTKRGIHPLPNAPCRRRAEMDKEKQKSGIALPNIRRRLKGKKGATNQK